MSDSFFNSRIAASALYRIMTVGTGCATLATYIADNVDGVGTEVTIGIVLLAVILGMLLYLAISELQGESYVFKRCDACSSVEKKIPAWIKGSVSAKALTLLRMEVVIFSTYFALSYADDVYNRWLSSCKNKAMPRRARVVGPMVAGCAASVGLSLYVSSSLATRVGSKCCSKCTLNKDNRFVTTRLET